MFTLGIQLDDRTPGRIRAVLDGSPAAAAGLRREDRILRVDGEAFTSLLQWQEAGPVRLDVRSRDGDREFTIRPLRQSFHRALARATSDSRRVIRCDDRRFIYLHLWAGTHEIFREALVDAVALANAEELDGFVLDLRDGYGGAWWPYLDSFFPNRESYFTATIVDRDGEGGTLRAEPQDNAHAFSGPLAVLINEGTRSGKESLAFQFEKTGRARLFGTKTAGAFTGGMGVFAERDAPYMLYLSVQESRLDGQRIEGIGVEPDIVTPDDSAEDRALLAALAHLGCRDGMN